MTARRWRWLTAAAGIACGLTYVISPLTVWLLLLVAALLAWMVRGLDPSEKGMVLVIFGLAVAVRVACVAWLFLATENGPVASFPWDNDGLYVKWRASLVRDLWAGMAAGPSGVWEAFHRSYGWTSYINVLAYIQYLTGPAPYGVHLVSVAFAVAAAAIQFRVVRSAFGPAAAMFGVAATLFLPTSIAWSVSALKESLYGFLGVAALAAAVLAVRRRGILARTTAVAVVAAAAAASGTVRAGGDVFVVAGIAAGVAAAVTLPRPRVLAAALVVAAIAGFFAIRQPAVRARLDYGIQRAASLQIGSAKSGGNFYRLLDMRLYDAFGLAAEPITPAEAARFFMRAVPVTLLVPLPWQARSSIEAWHLPQQVFWYVLLALAVPGFVAGMRRDALVAGLLLGMFASGMAMLSVINANIGTAARLRDTLVLFVVPFSGLGLVTLLSWTAQRLPPAPRGARRAWA